MPESQPGLCKRHSNASSNASGPMETEAKAAGQYKHELMGRTYDRIQIVTIQEILFGERLGIPMSIEVLKAARQAEGDPLAARKGSKESCNCKLSKAADTDNHIVLVDDATLKLRAKATPAEPPSAAHPKGVKARTAAQNTLKKREAQSQTAEFTPRARLTHPKLVGADLQKLIVANGGKLHVRITGLQMYDSEHAVGCHKLLRHTDWEIHPVVGLEYCPKNKKCTKDSDANWVGLEKQ